MNDLVFLEPNKIDGIPFTTRVERATRQIGVLVEMRLDYKTIKGIVKKGA